MWTDVQERVPMRWPQVLIRTVFLLLGIAAILLVFRSGLAFVGLFTCLAGAVGMGGNRYGPTYLMSRNLRFLLVFLGLLLAGLSLVLQH